MLTAYKFIVPNFQEKKKIYIYIYVERERERESQGKNDCPIGPVQVIKHIN